MALVQKFDEIIKLTNQLIIDNEEIFREKNSKTNFDSSEEHYKELRICIEKNALLSKFYNQLIVYKNRISKWEE